MTTSLTVVLASSIKTHDGEVSSIVLKEPKARSFFDHGEPFKMRVISHGDTDRVEFDYDHKVLAKFLRDMTGIDELILGTVAAKDFFSLRNAATNLIMGVVGPDPTMA
ncbi:hypothetical protein V1281_002638 [Nitrobacteraceae bacterium AZCC 2161]